jgi:hypothetical protein
MSSVRNRSDGDAPLWRHFCFVPAPFPSLQMTLKNTTRSGLFHSPDLTFMVQDACTQARYPDSKNVTRS